MKQHRSAVSWTLALALAAFAVTARPADAQGSGYQSFKESAATDDDVPPPPAAPPAPEAEMPGESSVVPWVVGGLLIGGGAAAILALSQDDDDDDSDDDDDTTPPPSNGGTDEECTDDDAIGKWEAEIETIDATITREFTLNADGTAEFQEVTDPVAPGPSASTQGDGTWGLTGCTLTLNSPISTMDGSGEIDGGRVVINGASFSK